MKEFIYFILIIYLGVLPVLIFLNWLINRSSFIYRSGLWIIATLFIVVTEAYATGSFGLIHLTYCIPFGIFMTFMTFRSLRNSINLPLIKINGAFEQLRQGEINIKQDQSDLDRKDEVGEFFRSLNLFLDKLKEASNFAYSMGQGNLSLNFTPLSTNDVLGNSLIMLQKKLSNVVNETNKVVKEAGEEGELNARINSEGKEGVWKDLSLSVNGLLDSIIQPVLEIKEVANAMSKGDLTKRYSSKSKGQIQDLAESLNKALDSLNDLLLILSDNAIAIGQSSSEMLTVGNEMSTNTTEIASAMVQMSNGAQTQVGRVDESSNLVEDMLKNSSEMKLKSEAINDAAKKGVSNSKNGVELVIRMGDSVGEIADYSKRTTE